MIARALDPELSRRLDELRDAEHEQVSWADIREVVESVLTTMGGDLTHDDVRLFAEVQALAKCIESTKKELSELRPEQIPAEHIPIAQDELDAVVSATEEATNAIMEAAETIEEAAELVPDEIAQKLTNATTSIYEACSFQDITGQRISKVVNALKEIEEKVDEMIAAFGEDESAKERVRQRRAEKQREEQAAVADPDKDLMGGPQMPTNANDQDDIDALLASMD